MLAYFRRCIYELAERLPMSKEAAEAAVSTQCGFANGAPELITDAPVPTGKEAAEAAVSTQCGFANGAPHPIAPSC